MTLKEFGIPGVGLGILWPRIRFDETYEQYKKRCIDEYKMECDGSQIKKMFYTTAYEAYDHAMSIMYEKDNE